MSCSLQIRPDIVPFERLLHRLENLLKAVDIAEKASERRVHDANVGAKLLQEYCHLDGGLNEGEDAGSDG